jgi:hypothetical protein
MDLYLYKVSYQKPVEALKTAHKEVREGKFLPERENDELTHALGNPEHGGRKRGTPGSLPLKFRFPKERKRFPDKGHERRMAREADRMAEMEETLRS